jgi:predicted TIM-barrel fold metal-dependent hydrolase
MTTLPAAIVDTHHHLWCLSDGHYPWLQEDYAPQRFILGEYRDLCRDYLPAQLRQEVGALPVVGSVHVEAERERGQALAETAWVLRQSDALGWPLAVVAWVDLLADDVETQLDRQLAWPQVRGVRFKPVVSSSASVRLQDTPGCLADPRWTRGLTALAARGLLWELRTPYWHLEEAAALIAQVPGLKVVVQHTGLPWDRREAGLRAWARGLRSLAALPEVHLKLSELGLRDRAWTLDDNLPVVRTAIDCFGAKRCLFGSNFPVARLRINYSALVQAMSTCLAHLTAAEQRAIWHDNAVALYRLAVPSYPGVSQ